MRDQRNFACGGDSKHVFVQTDEGIVTIAEADGGRFAVEIETDVGHTGIYLGLGSISYLAGWMAATNERPPGVEEEVAQPEPADDLPRCRRCGAPYMDVHDNGCALSGSRVLKRECLAADQ